MPKFQIQDSKFQIAFVALPLLLGLLGCHRGMYDQPRYEPLEASNFFKDGQASRHLPPHTVARHQMKATEEDLRLDEHLYTGKVNGEFATSFPMEITPQVLARGQERFNIYCSVCHGRDGRGQGMVVSRGFRAPPSFHIPRLRDEVSEGHIFDVITRGFGAMPSYASQVKVPDRWAIVAYVRALQLSQFATEKDVPDSEKAALGIAP